MGTAKVIELVGKSSKSWEDAVQNAVNDAGKTVRNIECVDVLKFSANLENGSIAEYKADVKVLFVVD